MPAEPQKPDAASYRGHVDFFGFHAGAGGFVFGGWVGHAAAAAIPKADLVLGFESLDLNGRGTAAFYPRAGLGPRGVGMVLFVPAAGRPQGEFFSVTTREHGGRLAVTPTAQTRECDAAELAALLAPLLAEAAPPLPPALCAALLGGPTAPRPGFTGANTLDQLSDRVLLEVDRTIVCPPDGLALIGWLLAAPGVVAALRLHGGQGVQVLDPARFVRVPRPGVIEAVGRDLGFDDVRCGFIAFAAIGVASYLEVETAAGEIGYRPLPAPQGHGMAAIQSLLEGCDLQFAEVATAFDDVLGPAIRGLAAARLAAPPVVARVDFGVPPEVPRASVVVPLYRRLDYIEPQLAFMAHDPGMAGVELLYVLDEPKRRREAENLCESLFARLAVPFTLLVLDRNLGFAPASNAGLAAARGATVCFLNSDAFPLDGGWLDALAARLADDPALGIVAPLLLHEDGTVQHQGMGFRRLPRYGNWFFSYHERLGLQPQGSGLHPARAVTGACIVMRSDQARALGGFDEAYVIGDFEDSDLCLRAHAAGLGCAVDFDVRLCHLGRRSQASTDERWRMNLVLYNAWLHHTRWAATLAGAAG